jgi:hypothetical protein
MRRASLLLIFLLLLSCTPTAIAPTAPGPTITYNPFATLSPTPFGPAADTATPETLPTDTVTPIHPVRFVPPQYTLNASLDYAAHTLTVDETIVYQNATGTSLASLVLAVEPNHWVNCFNLVSLTVDTQAADYSLNGHRLEVRLAAPLTPGGTVSLSLQYGLHLPAADSGHIFGYKLFQTNLVDWYPFIVPFSGGWLLHDPAEVGEHLAYEAATFDMNISVTPAMTLAASALLTDGRAHLERARTFAFSASPDTRTSSLTVNGVMVTSTYFASEQVAAQTVLQEVARALTTYSDRFGPCPYASLNIVESDFNDGMEYDGLFFLSRNFYTANDPTVLNYLIAIAVHETAHQWWFGAVGNDQALEPWLDEALATYSEYIFYQQNYPGVAEAWWAFRVDSFTPAGFVDTDIYHGATFRPYVNAVYLRGAQFLQEVRLRIGEDAFFAFLRDYVAQMGGRLATGDDFFRILRMHSQTDLSDSVAEYFLAHY